MRYYIKKLLYQSSREIFSKCQPGQVTFEVIIFISIVIYRVPTMFYKYFFSIRIISLQATDTVELAYTGRRELIIKDTELSYGTSSRAGRQPNLTEKAEPEEEKVIRNPGTSLSNSVLASLCISVPLFCFSAYQFSLLLSQNLENVHSLTL